MSLGFIHVLLKVAHIDKYRETFNDVLIKQNNDTQSHSSTLQLESLTDPIVVETESIISCFFSSYHDWIEASKFQKVYYRSNDKSILYTIKTQRQDLRSPDLRSPISSEA